jgi:alpha-galactosidase
MLRSYRFELRYEVSGKNYTSVVDANEHYTLDATATKDRVNISIVPKTKIALISCKLLYDYKFPSGAKVFLNGYQSWTYSPELTINDKMPDITPIGRAIGYKFNSIFGDYQFHEYSKAKGVFHGYTYAYIRNNEEVTLLGSLSERQGYTIFDFDMNSNSISIQLDVEGLTIDKEYKLFDLASFFGSYNGVFDEYFKQMKIKKPKIKHLAGYTSWYNYFGKITEQILLRDLEGMEKVKGYAGIFQIDDGYQKKVGDWLTLKEDIFPNGMRYISDAIHSKGLLAGIWIAPFACAKDSQLAAEHPDWLIKDKDGKPVLGGIAWGGAYTLDFYNKDAAAYIKKVFDTVLNEWGFDLVKLDFLYAECLNPRYNKTRGTIMCEAMDFLRECVGDKLILGCGVPLGPSFGKVDLCRISCDVDLKYRNKFYYYIGNREIVNTRSAMNNSIFRRHLDGRAFVNDPDVFFLRNENLRFTHEQKLLLAKVNNMFGNVLFVSDNIGEYDSYQLDEVKKAFTENTAEIISAEYVDRKNLRIVYIENKQKYQWDINIISGNNEIKAI